MAAPSHNQALAQAARARLAPLGLVRKGRSRTWIDDHGTWAIVVEFQHSQWARGTYLNVGPVFFWAPNGTGRFWRHPVTWTDSTGVEKNFVELGSTEYLDDELNRVVEAAASTILLWRSRSANPLELEEFLKQPFSHPDGGTEWDHWDLGAFYAFQERWPESVRHFLASRTVLDSGREKYRSQVPEGFDLLFACLDGRNRERCALRALEQLVASARGYFGLPGEWTMADPPRF